MPSRSEFIMSKISSTDMVWLLVFTPTDDTSHVPSQQTAFLILQLYKITDKHNRNNYNEGG